MRTLRREDLPSARECDGRRITVRGPQATSEALGLASSLRHRVARAVCGFGRLAARPLVEIDGPGIGGARAPGFELYAAESTHGPRRFVLAGDMRNDPELEFRVPDRRQAENMGGREGGKLPPRQPRRDTRSVATAGMLLKPA